MRTWLCLATLVAATMAGCVGSDGLQEDNGDAAPEAPTATLAAAPDWRVGEWWEVSYTFDFLNGAAGSVRVIVAENDGTTARLGMPADAFDWTALMSHWPLMGEITMSDLGISFHDAVIRHTDWPMEDGKTFQTTTTGGLSTVVVESPTVAEVFVTEYLLPIHYVYDAELRNIRELTVPGYGSFHVTDHGYGHSGDVIVPVDVDMPIFMGRAIGAVDTSTPPTMTYPVALPAYPGGPVDTARVAAADKAALAMMAGNFALVPIETAGYFRETAQLPDGTTREVEWAPTDGLGRRVHMELLDTEQFSGEWTMAHVAAGGGIVFTELMTWNEWHVTMADGVITSAAADADAAGHDHAARVIAPAAAHATGPAKA